MNCIYNTPRSYILQHLSSPQTRLYMVSGLPFHFNNFTYFFTLFSKFFSSFPHSTCLLSVSRRYLALDGAYHPFELHSQTTRLHVKILYEVNARRGYHPPWRSFPEDLSIVSQDPNFRIQRHKSAFQIWALACSLAVTRAIPVGFFSSAYWYA